MFEPGQSDGQTKNQEWRWDGMRGQHSRFGCKQSAFSVISKRQRKSSEIILIHDVVTSFCHSHHIQLVMHSHFLVPCREKEFSRQWHLYRNGIDWILWTGLDSHLLTLVSTASFFFMFIHLWNIFITKWMKKSTGIFIKILVQVFDTWVHCLGVN